MCPRKKTLADHDVARIVAGLVLEQGSHAVTFAEVSQRCGLAAPTLVQRFGNREGMLAAAQASFTELITDAFSAASPDGLPRISSALVTLARLPSIVHALDAGGSAELRKRISYGLVAAIQGGELPRCDIAALSRALQIAFYGALVLAAAEEADPASEVASALDAQLSAFI